MKAVHLASVLGLCLLAAGSAHAQQYLQPQWNGCITEDGPKGGDKIHNNCSISLSVQAISRDGSSAPWQVIIQPGGAQMSGWGTGGYELYVCPSNYFAVDGQGRSLATAAADYQCKKLD